VALAVPGVEVRVDEFYPMLKRAGKPQPLTSAARPNDTKEEGRRNGLGRAYVLGNRLSYRGRAVRVTLRPANAEQAHDLLPGAPLHAELMAFLQLSVGTKADVFLRMELSSSLVPEPRIGSTAAGPAPRLAWTTVLPSQTEQLMTIALGRYEAFPAPPPNPYLDRHRIA
jgi:type VI secretion system protein ImpH